MMGDAREVEAYPEDVNWPMVYHRIVRAREEGHPCHCKECVEYMRKRGLDTYGRELTTE